jgi:hypothetical protein
VFAIRSFAGIRTGQAFQLLISAVAFPTGWFVGMSLFWGHSPSGGNVTRITERECTAGTRRQVHAIEGAAANVGKEFAGCGAPNVEHSQRWEAANSEKLYGRISLAVRDI